MVLKKCAVTLSPIVSEFLNQCLGDNEIPDWWRTAAITPIPKTSSSKFCRIAWNFIALKCLEKLILPYFTPSLNVFVFHPFVWLSFEFTCNALVNLLHFIPLVVDSNSSSDFSDLFDCVGEHMLLPFLSDFEAGPVLFFLPARFFVQSTTIYPLQWDYLFSRQLYPRNSPRWYIISVFFSAQVFFHPESSSRSSYHVHRWYCTWFTIFL